MKSAIRTVSFCLLLLLGMPAALPPQDAVAAAQPSAIEAVWDAEEAYWKYVQAGDVERYVKLWHERFRGWPCVAEKPSTKAAIGGWVRDIRDQKIKVTYSLERLGAEQFDDVVIVYYSAKVKYRYPDGRVEGSEAGKKFTHTWLLVDGEWQIVGGMCASLDAAARTFP